MSEAPLFDAAHVARMPQLSSAQRQALKQLARGQLLYRVRDGWELGRAGRRYSLDTIRALTGHRLISNVIDRAGRPALKISPAGELVVERWQRRKQA